MGSDYVDGTSSDKWQTAYMTELAWSGVIETAAITLVFITDSDLLRAIGAWSMVLVNATSLHLISKAEDVGTLSSSTKAITLHGMALGQAIGTFISTFIMDKKGHFKLFGEKDHEEEMWMEWEKEMENEEGEFF